MFTARGVGRLRKQFRFEERRRDSTSSPSDQTFGDLCRGDRLSAAHDFIVAAYKTYGDALVSSEPKLPELIVEQLRMDAPRYREQGVVRSQVAASPGTTDAREMRGFRAGNQIDQLARRCAEN
jgi:hypothetical protein